ncbi:MULTISPECIES: MerR family transcriptional regulator [unclassified Isoptericola]|uniref:transcriptional regulator FtsR n=2 Tax=Isoptericola TaxID=254250 RepID=UPI0027122F29|nr:MULTISPECIES: MerR family transcriptional regulator [unclassified Isoptericola]MDO8144797.1 MerR family transcriptional regulator [Isoptericola sp. 178]MDO8149577.1 MerR family transcriptional regulator [Isoptericola sp. b515]
MTAGSGAASASEPDAPEPWPRGISRHAGMRISDVLNHLRGDFPHVSHSKLRFLEDQGLITPVRTPAGYRQYSPADVERLRFVLSEQRDSYLPLKVIKERLAAMDAGEPAPGPSPRPAPDGPGEDSRRRWTVESVAGTTGTSVEFVESLVTAGVLQPSGDTLDGSAAEVVRIVQRLTEHGIEPRHLRPLRASAARHVALVDQAVAPYRSHQNGNGGTVAGELAAELGDLLARLHTTWIRQGTDGTV